MIKKSMAFLFALGLSASYAFAAGDVTQCIASGEKVANCGRTLGEPYLRRSVPACLITQQ